MGKKAPKNELHQPPEVPPTPIYVKGVELRGIRSFRGDDQILDLTGADGSWAQWTLILGNNGTGKSTLLQLIARISIWRNFSKSDILKGHPETDRSPAVYIQDPMPFKNYFSKPFLVDISDSGAMEAYIRGDYNDQIPREVAAVFVGDETVVTGRQYFGTDDRSYVPTKLPVSNPLWNICGYGPWRSLSQSVGQRSDLTNLQCPHLFSESATLVDAEQWLLELDYGAEKHESQYAAQHRERFNQVVGTLKELLPEIVDIRIVPPEGPDLAPRAAFSTPYGEVSLKQLGYGYQSLIAWVVDFASRMYRTFPRSPDPLSEPAVCLIDEIDLHLHPSWQRSLMGFLSRPPRKMVLEFQPCG